MALLPNLGCPPENLVARSSVQKVSISIISGWLFTNVGMLNPSEMIQFRMKSTDLFCYTNSHSQYGWGDTLEVRTGRISRIFQGQGPCRIQISRILKVYLEHLGTRYNKVSTGPKMCLVLLIFACVPFPEDQRLFTTTMAQ